MKEKDRLRKEHIRLRKSMMPESVDGLSRLIREKLYVMRAYMNCRDIYIYVSHENEVDTLKIIEDSMARGKKVYVPKVVGKGIMVFVHLNSLEELEIGKFNILEPVGTEIGMPSSHDLIIMPGVVFDISCNRIGYGGGFYDRFLENITEKVRILALAYDQQVIDTLPSEAHDLCPDAILTERLLYCCNELKNMIESL